MRILLILLLAISVFANVNGDQPAKKSTDNRTPGNLLDEKLVAWCIVPFDSQNRSPAERAEMLQRIGLKRVAYDWRQK